MSLYYLKNKDLFERVGHTECCLEAYITIDPFLESLRFSAVTLIPPFTIKGVTDLIKHLCTPDMHMLGPVSNYLVKEE